ncbi:Phage protein [Ochrobactrum soli]|uniref:Phage protein n=2 Tax=Ochrobactrum soli TaxID=2448455 RepID=A0A2P9HMX8_9HYPH|nr:Phage protein [[Ochrobactrum] soli]
MSRIPAQWMPHVPMKRIICHWTAGTNTANDVDKKAYHILVQGDGSTVRGIASIAANSGKLTDSYAAHTLNCNTDSIGISMCGMAGAVESPFNAGKYPITKVQWDALVEAVAELAATYGIEVTPKTILFHAEVQTNLGIKQKNKWDVTRLPFDGSITGATHIGNRMRSEVSARMKGGSTVALEPMPVGGMAQAVTLAKTRTQKGGPDTGSIPAGTTVEVVAVDGMLIQIETPAGYLVWADRSDFDVVDGPAVETDTKPNPKRQKIAEIRRLLDSLEADLA